MELQSHKVASLYNRQHTLMNSQEENKSGYSVSSVKASRWRKSAKKDVESVQPTLSQKGENTGIANSRWVDEPLETQHSASRQRGAKHKLKYGSLNREPVASLKNFSSAHRRSSWIWVVQASSSDFDTEKCWVKHYCGIGRHALPAGLELCRLYRICGRSSSAQASWNEINQEHGCIRRNHKQETLDKCKLDKRTKPEYDYY